MEPTAIPEIPDDQGVTVVTSRRVKPGSEAAFEAWLVGIGEAAARFPAEVPRGGARSRRPTLDLLDRLDHQRESSWSRERAH